MRLAHHFLKNDLNNLMNMLKRLIGAIYKIFMPAKMYARHIGVKFGKNCLIATKNWSSEPYLSINYSNTCH